MAPIIGQGFFYQVSEMDELQAADRKEILEDRRSNEETNACSKAEKANGLTPKRYRL